MVIKRRKDSWWEYVEVKIGSAKQTKAQREFKRRIRRKREHIL